MGFNETVEYLYSLQKFGIKLGLDNTRAMLELVGRPDKKPKFLHVTGTNGKGSVSALSSSALQAAGHRTGLYTSPHLVSFTERIRVNGVDSTEGEVVALAEGLRGVLTERLPGLKPTFFEFTTVMAFDYFAKAGAETVVLEVGMGGRLDSTNVVEPECSVITNVDVEHTEYLGGTLEEIAVEKAGIIKNGVPLVTSEKKPPVVSYLEGVCREREAPMYLLGRDFSFVPRGFEWKDGAFVQRLDYYGPGGEINGLETGLIGVHQLENAATAACALEVMSERGVKVGPDAIRDGFRRARWEGRLEVVSDKPLLVLDGAHNPASAARLSESLKLYFKGRYRRLIIVLGALADKDFSAMYSILAPLADTLVLTRAEYERSAPLEALESSAKGFAGDVAVKGSLAEALEWALSAARGEDMVLVTGSLYLVGEAKAWLRKSPVFLKA